MRIAIGVSTGTEVVCAALVVEEADGSRTVEYRTVSADCEVNTDLGDLVASAIELMASLAPTPAGVGAHADERLVPDVIAVSYRTQEQASSIRSALSHTRWAALLVPESAAAYAFLDDSGLIARYRTVTIIDVGATGTTASVVDAQSGELLAEDRTKHFSGDVVNRLVKDLVHGSAAVDTPVRDDLRDDRGIGSARYRAVKEHLSTHDAAHVGDAVDGSTLDRAAFDLAVRPYVMNTVHFTERSAGLSTSTPEAVVLIGGGANIPIVGTAFGSALALPVVIPTEPDTVLAKGSALLALNSSPGRYPTVGHGAGSNARSIGRFTGAFVGALVVGGIVVAYVVQTLVPSDGPSVSPAGSAAPTAEQVLDRPAADGTALDPDITAGTSTTSGQTASSTRSTEPASATERPSATPSLHPAPDLPVIPWPAQPRGTTPAADTTTPIPMTTLPTTTDPISTPPDGSTELSPTGSPGESTTSPEPTPDTPSTTPEESTETSAQPTSSGGVRTTQVGATPSSPPLSPPATVWTPPPTGTGELEEAQRTESTDITAPPEG